MKTVAYSDVLYRAAELAGRTRDKVPVSEALMLRGFLAAELAEVWNMHPWPELIPGIAELSVTARRSSIGWYFTARGDTDGNGKAFIATNSEHRLLDGMTVRIVNDPSGVMNGTKTITINTESSFWVDVPPGQPVIEAPDLWVWVWFSDAVGDVLGIYSADPYTTTRCRALEYLRDEQGFRFFEELSQAWLEYMLPAPDLMAVADANLMSYPVPETFSNYIAQRAASWLLKSDGQELSAQTMAGLAERTLSNKVQRLPAAPWYRKLQTKV